VVAHLISDALDREVSVEELWSGRAQRAYLLAVTSQTVINRGRMDDGIDLPRAARDAVELANAALEAARPTPAVVRAVAASAFAQAQAAVGNARGFHSAAEEARALLETPGALDNLPPYLTWFWPANLHSQLAQGQLVLAGVTSRDCHDLRDNADAVISRIATDPVSTSRNAVFHLASLSRAHVAADDLDRAVSAAQAALRRLPTVRSRRCALLLHRLDTDLAALPPARVPASVRSLQDQLRAIRTA